MMTPMTTSAEKESPRDHAQHVATHTCSAARLVPCAMHEDREMHPFADKKRANSGGRVKLVSSKSEHIYT